MQNDVRRTFHELYVVEIDGVKQSEHRVFIEALKRGLELKRQYPRAMSSCAMQTIMRRAMGRPRRIEPGRSVG